MWQRVCDGLVTRCPGCTCHSNGYLNRMNIIFKGVSVFLFHFADFQYTSAKCCSSNRAFNSDKLSQDWNFFVEDHQQKCFQCFQFINIFAELLLEPVKCYFHLLGLNHNFNRADSWLNWITMHWLSSCSWRECCCNERSVIGCESPKMWITLMQAEGFTAGQTVAVPPEICPFSCYKHTQPLWIRDHWPCCCRVLRLCVQQQWLTANLSAMRYVSHSHIYTVI